jgi:spore coat protein U-like protein
MKKILSLSALALGLSLSSTVFAGTATGTLTVTATILDSCAINTDATGTVASATLNFGEISSFASDVDAEVSTSGTSLAVYCNGSTTWSLSANQGVNSTDSTQRLMILDGTTLAYDLYSDSARSTAIEVDTAFLTGSGSSDDITIYGRIPSGTALPSAGTYTDTVTLTLTY